MQPFNPDAKCAKCGSDNIHSIFCVDPRYYSSCRKWPNEVREEHIHRNCKTCRYEWLEAPLDKKVDTDA